MQKAHQEFILQRANVHLTEIRRYEVRYFITFFGFFGTQCAVMASLVMQLLSQTPALGDDCAPFWNYLYWIASAIVFVFGMYGLLTAVFISVFGERYALRGRTGAMASTVDFKVKEQNTSVIVLSMTVFMYVVSMVGCYFVVMDQTAASISTGISGLLLIYTYNKVMSIFNRFKFTKQFDTNIEFHQHDQLMETIFGDTKDEAVAPEAIRTNSVNVTTPQPTVSVGDSKPPDLSSNRKSNSLSYLNGIISSMRPMSLSNRPSNNSLRESLNSRHSANSTVNNPFASRQITHAHSGYITLRRVASSRFSFMLRDPLCRVYAVVNDNRLFFYHDKKSFENYPDVLLPERSRPISLELYSLDHFNIDSFGPYTITLKYNKTNGSNNNNIDVDTPNKVDIELQCDTPTEATQWIGALQKGINMGRQFNQSINSVGSERHTDLSDASSVELSRIDSGMATVGSY